MPRMVCCNKTWSVGSDDFVVSSILGAIFRLVWITGLIAITIVLLVGEGCFTEDAAKKIVYTFIFSQIFIQACVLVSEALVGLISSRGTINDAHPRRHLPHFLCLRAFLYLAEVVGCVFGCYVAWSSHIKDDISCAREDRIRLAIQIYVISVIVILIILAVMLLVYYDPLGLQTPSLLNELYIKYSEDETYGGIDFEVKKFGWRGKHHKDNKTTKLYSASSKKQWARRIRMLCCCVGGHNSRAKLKALEDIANAMATMFHGVDFVLSDFVTALMLVHRDQKAKIKSKKIDLAAELRSITYQLMDDKSDSFFTPNYPKHATEEKVDFSLPETRLMVKDIKHYLKFALGIYGWPLYVYLNPICGSVCLCSHLKYRTIDRDAGDFIQDNCCLANTAALELCSHLENKDVIFVSYENKICMPPFSLCFDHPNKAMVLSIRGSMSLEDALTDMHISMQDITVDDDAYKNLITKVHCGMHGAAKYIMKQVDMRLQKVFACSKYHNYKLILTGHSLGAGVAAVLAVLYHSRYRHLHCYAFSPPGSLFTLPLVEYSKSFITTIIYGNDIVPRLTFRGLLYLKKNLTHLLMHCKLPKHAVLFPSLFSCCYGKYRDHHHQQEFNSDIYNHSVEEGLPISANTSDQLTERANMHQFVERMYTVEQTPAFVPGRVLYIREIEKRIRRRFWNIFGEREIDAVWKPNEDFCHIIVDDGMFDHHLPDSVVSVINRLYNQHISGRGRTSSSVPTVPMSRQVTVLPKHQNNKIRPEDGPNGCNQWLVEDTV